MRMLRAILYWWMVPVREELEALQQQVDQLEWRLSCVEQKAVQRRFAEPPQAS